MSKFDPIEKDNRDKFAGDIGIAQATFGTKGIMLISSQGKFAWFSAAVLLLAFVMPLYKKAVPLAVGLVVLARIVEQISAPKHFTKGDKTLGRLYALLFAFYGLHLLGLAWSSNIDFGLKDLEYKLSFLIFPMLFYPLGTKDILLWRKAAVLFVLGYVTHMAITLVQAGILYSQGESLSVFFYSGLSTWFHPSYQAMYGVWCLVLLFYFLSRGARWYHFTGIGAILIYLVLLNSKAGFGLTFVALLVGGWIYYDQVRNVGKAVLLSVITIGFFSAVLFSSSTAMGRVSRAVNFVKKEQFQGTKDPNAKLESNAARSLVWKIAGKEVMNNPFGVGTGDVKDHLIASYEREGAEKAARQKLNPHNQFLQTGVALGLPGIFLLLAIFAFSFYQFLRSKRWVMAFFPLLVGANCLVESMLEVQSGVVFFVFWILLLMNDYKVPEAAE